VYASHLRKKVKDVFVFGHIEDALEFDFFIEVGSDDADVFLDFVFVSDFGLP